MRNRNGHAAPERNSRHTKEIAALTRKLAEAQARIAELTSELERRSAQPSVIGAGSEAPGPIDPLLSRLTRRERTVAILFSQTGCDKVVANHLGRAVQTVRNQIASVLTKLGLNSRDQLLVLLLSTPPSDESSRCRPSQS